MSLKFQKSKKSSPKIAAVRLFFVQGSGGALYIPKIFAEALDWIKGKTKLHIELKTGKEAHLVIRTATAEEIKKSENTKKKVNND